MPDPVLIRKPLPHRLHVGPRKGDVILDEHCTNVLCPPIKSTNQQKCVVTEPAIQRIIVLQGFPLDKGGLSGYRLWHKSIP